MNHQKGYSTHHIVPRSMDGSNRELNLITLKQTTHRALHTIFENKTPPEQLRHILRIASSALTQDVKSDIIKILENQDLEYWYKKGVLK